MGALNPIFLLAGLAVGVPIFLHLFQRHQTRRVSFPALRYLERTERDHARQIRLRQLLLLLARVAVLLLLVGAGARLFFSGRGGSHPPTATVIIIDNSMSSSLVVGEDRVLDELKAIGRRSLDVATDEDRFWVIRAGEPWLPAIPGGTAEALAAIEETVASDAHGDITSALERATQLLRTSGFEHTEIHLLSDMQRTAFTLPGNAPAAEIAVVAWTGHEPPAANRALTAVVVGAGLPPLLGQRTEVTVTALEGSSASDTVHVPIRLVVNERIRGAATLPPGAQATIAMPPSGTGWIQGYADADPDDLRADDRRFFAFRSRAAPSVSIGVTPGVFVTEALAVLEGASRLRRSDARGADLLITDGGVGLDTRVGLVPALVIPPSDPTLLPALNRRLADAGIPWRFDPASLTGEAMLAGSALPPTLERVTVRAWHELALTGNPTAPTFRLAEIEGRPWAVEGVDAGGRRYLLLASPMTGSATTLPVSTGMLRFVDWVASEWAGAGGGAEHVTAGSHLPAPAAATHVRLPRGVQMEVDGTRMVRGTGQAGFYTFLANDTVVSVVAVNTPTAESYLELLQGDDFDTAVGDRVVGVDRADSWERSVYRARQGPEAWWPFLFAALALLMIEAVMATSGLRGSRPFASRETPVQAADGHH